MIIIKFDLVQLNKWEDLYEKEEILLGTDNIEVM